jgi:hypothetical protein
VRLTGLQRASSIFAGAGLRFNWGDTIDLHAACASEIMASSIQLQIKILNDNSVSRIFQDPDFKGMTFYRCAM